MPRKGKCFSTCRKRPKPECKPSDCYYTNGNKYKYCRLAFTHKMGKDCIPVPRNPNHRKTTKDHSTKEKIEEFRTKYAKKIATRKIARFLRKTDPRVRSKFLQSVCSDAGVCIAFGKHADAIRKHFSDFNDFGLLSKPINRIGAVSSNGFVKEFTYEHRGYVANAILKSSSNKSSDNLLYEAMVGFFLNKHSKHLPNFLDTYGLYEYNNYTIYHNFLNNKTNAKSFVKIALSRIAKNETEITDDQIRTSCEHPTNMAVLIQHLKGAETVKEKLKDVNFIKNDLAYVLFQVYMALYTLGDTFTHYDLHHQNVLVYEPVKGKYIEYHYHLDNGSKLIFRSPYIAKIIDYGRCYYNDKGNDSKAFREKMCKMCVTPACGAGSGYTWLNTESTSDNYFISSKIHHPSHDLRLLVYTSADVKYDTNRPLEHVMNSAIYGEGIKDKYRKVYGTKPNKKSGLPSRIQNVSDAYKALLKHVNDTDVMKLNDANYGDETNRLGQLHVYHDHRPMRYVSE